MFENKAQDSQSLKTKLHICTRSAITETQREWDKKHHRGLLLRGRLRI